MTSTEDVAPRARRATTMRAARIVRRVALPIVVALVVAFFWFYGALKVPEGMDTMPAEYPGGTVCVIRKSPGAVGVGAVVFVDLPSGGTLLSRVSRVEDDAFWVEHDNPESRFPDGEELGGLPFTAVRGLVLSGFRPDDAGTGRGK